MDSNAVLLKLILNKCHLNNFNVFNQIGLVALNCIGTNILPGQPEASNYPESVPSSSQSKTRAERDFRANEYDGIDPDVVTKIKHLEQAKIRAVSNEMFDEAKRMK